MIKKIFIILITALITYGVLSYTLDKVSHPYVPKVREYWVSSE